jgi:hypothetical protein
MPKRYTILASASGDELELQPLCDVAAAHSAYCQIPVASRSAGIRRYQLIHVVDNQTGEVVMRAPKTKRNG